MRGKLIVIEKSERFGGKNLKIHRGKLKDIKSTFERYIEDY